MARKDGIVSWSLDEIKERLARGLDRTDWARLDATGEAEIAAQIAADPDDVDTREAAMASKEVVETVYGRYSKYEIVRTSSFTGISFYIYKDGKPYRGSFPALAAAVEAARSEG